MADNDTETSALPEASGSEIKLDAYGYRGEPTPDEDSLHAKGDRNNPLSATDKHQSVALTVWQRQHLFGSTGDSTGRAFRYGDNIYYDDDTSPQGDYRIEVYEPGLSPAKLTPRTGYESRYPAPGQVSKSPLMRGYRLDQLELQAPVREHESREEFKRERDTERTVGDPADSILAPENLLPKIRAQYPEYKDVSDQKLWTLFKRKYDTGLKQLRLAYPQYEKVPDDRFLQAIHAKFFPKDSDDQFIDRVNPPKGAMGVYHDFAEQMPEIIASFHKTGLAEPLKFPERTTEAINRAVIALGLDQAPQLTKDQELVQKRLEALGYKQPHTPALTETAKSLWQGIAPIDFVRKLFHWGTQEAKTGEALEKKVPEPRGVVGQTGRKFFGGIGALPAIAPAFIGGEGFGPLLLGMAYDAIQGEGAAREKGLDNSLMFGGEGAGYRALQQWLIYTPRGRMLSALLWASAGVTDQEAQAFLTDPKGTLDKAFKEPVNTISDLVSTAAVNVFFGGLASLGVDKLKPEARTAYDEAVQARESGDYRRAAQLLDRTMLLLPEPARKAVTNNLLAWRNEAVEARLGDAPMEMPGQRGFLVLKGEAPGAPDVYGTRPLGAVEMRPKPSVIELGPSVEELQRRTSTLIPEEEAQSALMRRAFQKQEGVRGLLISEPRQPVRPVPRETLTYPTGAEPKARVPQETIPEPALTVRYPQPKTAEHIALEQALGREPVEPVEAPKLQSDSPADRVTDQFYYSGIDFGKAYEELAGLLKKWGVRELLAPSIKEARKEDPTLYRLHVATAKQAEAIIAKHLGIEERDNARFAQVIIKRQQLENHLKWAYETDHRLAFWRSISEPIRMKQYEQHGNGLSTGDATADRMWKLHDKVMDAIAKVDEARGFHYPLREHYIFQDLEKPEDIDRLEADIVRMKWGDPKFMRPRQIPTPEMVHLLGYRFKRYIPELNMQARVAMSNRAQALAAMLEEMHDAELAFTKAELEKIEKQNPQQAADIRSQLWRATGDNPQGFWRSPKAKGPDDAHEIYYLHQAAGDLLVRAFNQVEWNPKFVGELVSTAQAVKGVSVGINLAWSLYHPVHILSMSMFDTVAHAFGSSLARTGRFSDWARALEDILSFGFGSHIRSQRAQKLLNWFQVKDASRLRDLSPHDQQLHGWLTEAGATPLLTPERQLQFYRWILAQRGKIPKKPGLDLVDLAYSILSTRGWTMFYFGRVIPQLKIMSFARSAEAMFSGNPHLLRPEYTLDRMQALRGIWKQVEDRYGEKNLRLSFESPHLKAVGVGLLTSYSWLSSAIGTFGGGIHDLTKVVGKDRPITHAGTNRVAFLMSLTLGQMMVQGAISQFIGDGIHSLMDLIWANIGKDEKGKPIRIRLPFWTTTEFGSAWYDVQREGLGWGTVTWFRNKMAPALFTIAELANNHDYYGTEIGPGWDKNKGYLENLVDFIKPRLEYTLRQSAPFVVQEMFKPGANERDVMLAFFGAPIAARQTMRSAMENRIINDYVKKLPWGRTKEAQDKINAKTALRQAIQKDDGYAREEAIQKMRDLKIDDKQIVQTQREANETEAQRLFSHMSSEEQGTYWKDMSSDEQAEFEPFLREKERSALSIGE